MKQLHTAELAFNAVAPGVQVFVPSEDKEAHRIQLNAGTREALSGPTGHSYAPEAMVPRHEWRDPTPDERGLIFFKQRSVAKGKWISVVQIPSALLEPFEELQKHSQECQTVTELQRQLRNPDCDLGGLIAYLRDRFAESPILPIEGGIHVNSPNMPTTTTDPRSRLLVGLHLDSWYSSPVDSRHLSPNRACINLGRADRFFLFLNLPLHRMKDVVEAHCPGRSWATATSVARAFMRLFPLYPVYPVFRLRICPGEAYLTPTENLAHDGSSAGMSCLDVTLSVSGCFHAAEAQR